MDNIPSSNSAELWFIVSACSAVLAASIVILFYRQLVVVVLAGLLFVSSGGIAVYAFISTHVDRFQWLDAHVEQVHDTYGVDLTRQQLVDLDPPTGEKPPLSRQSYGTTTIMIPSGDGGLRVIDVTLAWNGEQLTLNTTTPDGSLVPLEVTP